MLQSLRENSQGIIAKIIVGFIIITFALWGVDSLVGLATSDGAPVTVNGVEISEQQIQQGMELQRRQMLAQMGENADPSLLDDKLVRNLTVQRLIEETVLLEAAEGQGLAVGNNYLDQIMLSTPDFQVDGQFNRDQFDGLLRNAGLTPMMYRDLLRRETLIGQGRSAVAASAFVVPSELDRLRALDRQQRDLAYLEIPASEVLAAVELSEEEIAAYYDAQRKRFVTEEQVVLNYLTLELNELALQAEVDEAELQTAYEQLVNDFEADEAREASHILVAVGTDRDLDAAKARADEVKVRLDAGESFVDLAAEYSDDPGSADQGGSLGLVEAGVMVPEFEEALFALAEGAVSAPVETDFGYHLIKLDRIEGVEPPSLEEVRGELVEQLQRRQAEAEFVAMLEQLADVSFAAADLTEPAQELGLTIQQSEPFSRQGGNDYITSAPRVIDAAFSDDVLKQGHNSPVIELGPELSVVIRVKEHLPSRQQPLAEVREQVVAELKQQKAAEQVGEQARLIAQQLEQGVSPEVELVTQGAVQRGDRTLPTEVVRELFRMPKPQADQPSVTTVSLADGSAVVMQLLAVSEGEQEALGEQELAMLRGFLANRRAQQDYDAMVKSLRDAAEVERL